MKHARRCQWVPVLSLVLVSVIGPVVFLSSRISSLAASSIGEKVFPNDISGIRRSSDALRLTSVEQDEGEEMREPERLVLEDREDFADSGSATSENLNITKGKEGGSGSGLDGSLGLSDGLRNGTGAVGVLLHQNSSVAAQTHEQDKRSQTTGEKSGQHSRSHSTTDDKIREIKDQLITANAYLHFAPPSSNSHLVRELKLRIKEMERVLGHVNKDRGLSRSALQRKRAMEASLAKARNLYPDCDAMATKLRSMAYNTEEQLRAQKNQASYLVQLAARTFPKGLHCLSMRLTTEYFTLQPADRELRNKNRVKQPNLYHYAIFSDNVLACAAVVNSTSSTSMDQNKVVFHVVTDALNYPAIKMWFLLNPPGQATIQIENIDDFKWLPSGYTSLVKELGVKDPRYSSVLNHLRFYLPQIFPYLDKIMLLDHDVIVQRDLSGLWNSNMKGKVNGAVEKCRKGESFHRLEGLVDFSDPSMAKSFNSRACVWAFGMNMFDLQQWQKLGLTSVYYKWLQMLKMKRRPLLRAGTLPLGQVTFYNHTHVLDRRWHVLGLGYDPDISRSEIEKAAVIHYDGTMKPWLEISITKYKGYWNRFLNYDLHYMQQCNIHQ